MENPILELNSLIEKYVDTFNTRATLSPLSMEHVAMSTELKNMQKQVSILTLYLYGYEKNEGKYERRIPVRRVVENCRIKVLNFDTFKEIDFLPRYGLEYEGMPIDNVERFYPPADECCPFSLDEYAIFRLTLSTSTRGIYRYVYYKKTTSTPTQIKNEMLLRAGLKPIGNEDMDSFVLRHSRDIREIQGNDGYWYYTYIEDGAIEIVNMDSGLSLSPSEIVCSMTKPILDRIHEEETTGRIRRGRFRKIHFLPRAGTEFEGRTIIKVEEVDPMFASAPFKEHKHAVFIVTYKHIDNMPDNDFFYIRKVHGIDCRDLLIAHSGALPGLQEGERYFRQRVERYIQYALGTDGYMYYFYHDYEDNMAAYQEWTGEFLTREEIDKYLADYKLPL